MPSLTSRKRRRASQRRSSTSKVRRQRHPRVRRVGGLSRAAGERLHDVRDAQLRAREQGARATVGLLFAGASSAAPSAFGAASRAQPQVSSLGAQGRGQAATSEEGGGPSAKAGFGVGRMSSYGSGGLAAPAPAANSSRFSGAKSISSAQFFGEVGDDS